MQVKQKTHIDVLLVDFGQIWLFRFFMITLFWELHISVLNIFNYQISIPSKSEFSFH